MRIIKLHQWRRIKLALAIPLFFIFAMLSTFNSFASDNILEAQNSFDVQQQRKQVKGTVVDVNGEPIIGANIIEKGTTNGTVTDINGNFSLEIASDGILQISYVGYLTQEIDTEGQTTINVTLLEDTHALDELIVIGYGTMKKSDLTGSVSRVILDERSLLPNMDLTQALAGTMAGINLQSRGMAGGSADITIRGQTTLSANKTPLIVVDGIIFNGELNEINVNDIEYIDVLKDASAAAVYGSRSANGVIIITTKRGKGKEPRIAFNAYYGTQFQTNHPVKFMNGEQYAVRMVDYYYQQRLYDWYNKYARGTADMSSRPVYPDITNREVVASSLRTQEERDNYLAGNSIDWLDVIMRDSPIIQNYDVSYSGSTDRVNYYLSGSYTGEEGIIRNDQWERMTLNTKVDANITDWISIGFNINYSHQDYSGLEANFEAARLASPLANYDLDSPDNWAMYLTGENYMPHPLGRLKAQNEDIRKFLFWVANAKIDIPFVKGLSYEFNYSNSYWNRKNNTFYPSSISDGAGKKGRAEKYPSERNSWIFNNIFTYLRDFGDHRINATLLYSREKSMGESYRFRAEGFDNETLGYNQMTFGTIFSTDNNSRWQETGVSYMGRLNYTYRDRYMATATVRRDGFSMFGPNSKYVTLPSFSIAWITSEEPFMDNLKSWLYLKLRLSYGENGNQGAGRYSSMAKMSSDNYVFGSNTAVAVYPNYNSLGNASLAWEETSSFNLGIDFGFLRNQRIAGSFDIYTSNTTNVLVTRRLPFSSGYEQGWTNIGKVNTWGIDFELRTRNIESKDFNWSSAFIFTLSRDEITKLYGGPDDKDIVNLWFVGEPILSLYDYNILGVWQEEDLYSKTYIEQPGMAPAEMGWKPGEIYPLWRPGQWKYEDLNGDGIIDPDNDRKVIGHASPNYQFSFSNTFNYKNWSLYFMLNAIQGGNGYYMLNNSDFLCVSARSDDVYRVNQPAIRQYWTPDNKVTNAIGIYNNPPQQGNIYQDRSFVRLQDVSLMYSFTPAQLERLGGFDYMQLYVSGKNLYTWTNWEGWDPELAHTESNRRFRPNTRNIVVGVKFAF